MRLPILGLLALLAPLASACDDGTNLDGVYEVTSNVSSMPCGTDAPVTDGPAYLKFHKQDFFGTEYYVFDSCRDAEATDCDSGNLFDGLAEQIDNGWKGVVSSSSGGGTTCALGYEVTTAVLDGNQIDVDNVHYADVGPLPAEQCTTEEAEKRNTSMMCEEHAHIIASKRSN